MLSPVPAAAAAAEGRSRAEARSGGNSPAVAFLQNINSRMEKFDDDIVALKATVAELVKLDAPFEAGLLQSLLEKPDKFHSPAFIRANRAFVKGQVPRERIVKEFGEEALVFFKDVTTDVKFNPRPKPEEIMLAFAGDLAALLTNLEPNDVLFIDEIHRLSPVVEEILYPALEDYKIDIMIGEGPAARSIKLDLQPFTLVGATTRAGMLTNPLRDRFGIVARLEFYTSDELLRIVTRSAGLMKVPMHEEGGFEIARRSRGTPRIANRLLRRVRDYADVKGKGLIDLDIANRALAMLDVDPQGFDLMDRKLLEAVIHRFDGGPVGLDNIAASIGEERETIEDVIEPYLIQQGFLQRTPRGRIATLAAYRHLGVAAPQRDAEIPEQ